MRSVTNPALPQAAWLAYALAALFLVLPAVDLLSNVLPIQPGELRWRYGTLGLLANFWLTPLLGVLLLVVAGAVLEHGRFMRGVAYGSGAIALLVVLATGLFALDVLQLRPTVAAEARRTFDIGALKAIVKHVTTAGFLVAVFVTLRRHEIHGTRRRESAPLMRAPRDKP